MVLEYERGREGRGCTQSDATDFELFSIPLHFPNPTLKTLSALAEKRNTAEVVFGKTHKLVGENNRSAAPYIPLDHNLTIYSLDKRGLHRNTPYFSNEQLHTMSLN